MRMFCHGEEPFAHFDGGLREVELSKWISLLFISKENDRCWSRRECSSTFYRDICNGQKVQLYLSIRDISTALSLPVSGSSTHPLSAIWKGTFKLTGEWKKPFFRPASSPCWDISEQHRKIILQMEKVFGQSFISHCTSEICLCCLWLHNKVWKTQKL